MSDSNHDIVPDSSDNSTAPPSAPQELSPKPAGAVLTFDVWGNHRAALARDAATDCGVTFSPGVLDELAGRLRHASGIGEFMSLRFGWQTIYASSFGKLAIITDVNEGRAAEILAELGFANELQICAAAPSVSKEPSLPLDGKAPTMLPGDGPLSFIHRMLFPSDVAEIMTTWHETTVPGRRPLCLLNDPTEIDRLAAHAADSFRRTREIVDRLLAIAPGAVISADPIRLTIAIPAFEQECRTILSQAGIDTTEVYVEFEQRFAHFSELPPSTPEGPTS